jgi:SRSO17 transposase
MDTVKDWEQGLEALLGRMAGQFRNRLGRERLEAYVKGLLGSAERKNGWQLAEQAGDETPYAMQQFIYRGDWSADEVRDETREYAIEHLGDPKGVLVVDETGFLKKGEHSAGVARQYSGTAGRVENCQIGVFLGYVGPNGRTLIDRELYLPQGWTDDPERCRRAGIGEEIVFHTKPQLAGKMLDRALAGGVPAEAVTGDSVYGDNPSLRADLEARPLSYVLGISINERKVPVGMRFKSVIEIKQSLPESAWTRLSAGDGSKGPRLYDWQSIPLSVIPRKGWQRRLLFRRSVADPSDVHAFICFCKDGTSLEDLVRVAGCRWAIETCIEEAKGEVGLDEYEVRTFTGWYRHITLACLAHCFLSVTRAIGADVEVSPEKGGPILQRTSSMAAFKASRGLSYA